MDSVPTPHAGAGGGFRDLVGLADILAITSMISFLYEHTAQHLEHPFEGAIVFASIVFISILVWRDVRFLMITERLAKSLERRGQA